jgi:hypothetical protein
MTDPGASMDRVTGHGRDSSRRTVCWYRSELDGAHLIDADPLLFRFRLLPGKQDAEVTIISTGDGQVLLHPPDAPDATVRFSTVSTDEPTFTVSLTLYDGLE